jgi:hypothetical protein
MEKTIAQNSLVKKLAEACNAVGGVEKKGRNEHQKYNYVRAADVAKAIRRELFKRSIILTGDEKEFTQTGTIETMSGGELREFTLKVEYTLRDGETGETLPMTAYGVAMDAGDKAIYKCKTNALKYFLRGIGIIPDEKDDVEADVLVDKKVEETFKKNFEKKTKGQTNWDDWQVRNFTEACVRNGKTAQQQADYLKQKFQVSLISELKKADYYEAMKFAKNDTSAESLTTSVDVAKAKRPERTLEPVPDQAAGD